MDTFYIEGTRSVTQAARDLARIIGRHLEAVEWLTPEQRAVLTSHLAGNVCYAVARIGEVKE